MKISVFSPGVVGETNQSMCRNRKHVKTHSQSGLTLIELIVAITILLILTGAAVPIVRVRIQREKEHELHRALWEMRDAIDRYKDAADRGAFQTKGGSENYQPDMDTT